jgi:hypothetical protein
MLVREAGEEPLVPHQTYTTDFSPIQDKLVEVDAHVAFNAYVHNVDSYIYLIFYKKTKEPINPHQATYIEVPEKTWLPAIACTENNVYIAYKGLSSAKIFLRKSADAGYSFQPRQIIVDNPGSGSPAVDSAATGDKVYVAWTDYVQPQRDREAIFFRRSTDSGATFPRNPNTENMSYGTGWQRQPKIGAWVDLVFLMWSGNQSGEGDPDQHIVLARSTDSGASFSSMSIVGGGNWFPDMAVSSIVTRPGYPPIVSVVWDDPSSDVIYYRRSTDGGVSFDTPLQLSTAGVTASTPRVRSYYDHTVHVVFSEIGQPGPVYRRSTDYGATFGPPQLIGNFESFAAIENNVYVVGRKGIGSELKFLDFRKSIDGGQTFGPEMTLHHNHTHSLEGKPSIATPNP